MDWRSGSRQNVTGSAFRGISTRGRGRGRGRGAPSNGRGGHSSTPTGPTSLPSTPPAPAPASAPVQASPSLNLPPRPKPPSRRGSHPHPRRAPSLDLSKANPGPTEQPTNPAGRPQTTRHASHNPPATSHNPPSITVLPIPSLKVEPSTPSTPGFPRPKPSRKRSHNRTRSSSKGSTQGRLSATPSVASLKEKTKDTPPHLALVSAPPDVQSFELRSNIDTLVERVRAMAMAGSAAEKDKEGLYTSSEGHIDWAGDEDDTLPDLDDWVRPKSAEPKEVDKAESDKASEQQVLSSAEEAANPSLPQDKGKDKQNESISEVDSAKDKKKNQRTENAKEVKELKANNESNSGKDSESAPGKTKSRGKQGKKKGSTSEGLPNDAGPPSVGTKDLHPGLHLPVASQVGTLSSHPPLVHPLPPKPQVAPSPSSARGPKPRSPLHVTSPIQAVARPADIMPEGAQPSVPSSEEKLVQALPQSVRPALTTEPEAVLSDAISSEPEVGKRAFDPGVDWAKAPRPSNRATHDQAPDGWEPFTCSTASPSKPQTRKRAFDPSVDWSKAPLPTGTPSPTRRSPTRSHPGTFSRDPHTAPPHVHPQGPFPTWHNGTRPVNAHVPPAARSRSQVNSPEASTHRLQDRDGPTHLRAHSSPQTGPGTRTHASRPTITLDAISRLSRTLGVPGASTPPRGRAVGVTVVD